MVALPLTAGIMKQYDGNAGNRHLCSAIREDKLMTTSVGRIAVHSQIRYTLAGFPCLQVAFAIT